MTDQPDVKLRGLVNFPVRVTGGTAIDIEKANGEYTIDLDVSGLVENTNISVGDVAASWMLIWNKPQDAYRIVPYALAATAGVASLDGHTGALDIGASLTFTGDTLELANEFETRSDASAAAISTLAKSITVKRYGTGYPLSYATYIPGTSGGPLAFQEAGHHWWELDLSGGEANIFWFNVAGDDRVEHTAINAAIVLLAAAGGGRMYFPRPPVRYHITSPIQGKANISFSGDGGISSKIYCDDCNGIELDFNAAYGKVVIEDLYFEGMNGTGKRYAIKRPGTLDDADELYGVTISRVLMRHFYAAMHFRATRNLTVFDCWGEHLNSGIELIGKNIVCNIIDNRFVRADGYSYLGDGLIVGVDVDYFDFTSGTGIVPCEGVEVHRNNLFGFTYGIRGNFANSANFENNNISATLYGVWISDINGMCSIQKNDIELSTGAAESGIHLAPQGSANPARYNLKNNHIIGGTGVVGVSGIFVGDFQHNVTIEGNTIERMVGYDIKLDSPGKVRVHDNTCLSTAVTAAIRVDTRQFEVITVTENNCRNPITIVSASDLVNRYVVSENNVVNGVPDAPYVLTSAGTPQSVVTSGWIGQDCLDSVNGKWYRANAAGVNNAWVALN